MKDRAVWARTMGNARASARARIETMVMRWSSLPALATRAPRRARGLKPFPDAQTVISPGATRAPRRARGLKLIHDALSEKRPSQRARLGARED